MKLLLIMWRVFYEDGEIVVRIGRMIGHGGNNETIWFLNSRLLFLLIIMLIEIGENLFIILNESDHESNGFLREARLELEESDVLNNVLLTAFIPFTHSHKKLVASSKKFIHLLLELFVLSLL
jgi:hypothetical protein